MNDTPAAPPGTVRPQGALAAEEARRRFRGLATIMVASVVALGGAGWWAYAKVRESLREIRHAGLTSLLEAEVGSLVLWIEEKKRDAERWASTPAVQAAAVELVRLAQASDPATACASPVRRRFLDEIVPFIKNEEAIAFNVVLADGTIVASSQPAYCGRRIASQDFIARMAPAFEGRTVFIRPYAEGERVPGVPPIAGNRPLVWVETPVRDAGGRIVGALGFARDAEERFTRILMLTTSGSSREAFAFDRRGVMLTQSRFLGASGTPVRESRLFEEALAAHQDAAGGEQGVLLEPYRSYRGAEVIGAWRWLPLKEMAVAVEIESGEAYAPLQYVQAAFAGLFVFLVAALAAAGGTSLWAVRLRLREARRMGQYELEREIGEGGMSRVYLARHTHLKRPTAVKVLKTALASDEIVTRFEREVQLCSQLSHPNTIEIYDYGRTRDGTFYYAMEYLRGISLEELVRRDGALPIGRAVHVLRQVCGSLKEAHENGLVHRDVKPQNLMLCLRGAQYDVVKVLDFGLVKEVHNPHTRDITQFAKVLGTPLYMAPERLRNPADADARADIYALAAVAYFILTGKPVFQAETDHDLVYRILNDRPPTLAQGGAAGVPAALEALVARCLAKDREDRPKTIDEVAAVLAEVAVDYPWREIDARRWWSGRAAELGIDLRSERT